MKEIEYLDLVDEQDNVIWKEDREVIYAKWMNNYRVVNIFVINNMGEILLPKRDMTRRIFPWCYDFSCWEHVQAGESYLDGAIRWLAEELNIIDIEPTYITKLTPSDWVSSYMWVFTINHNDIIKPNKTEWVESFSFYPFIEIKKMIEDNPKQFKWDMPKVFEIMEKYI